jgi:LuxR family maltose regulon positive regulatory protein
MTTPLLATKLYFPPARPNLVTRPRLVARLQDGLQGPLTLLSAPAGSGKTMLLSEWRLGPGAGVPVAWLTLDPGDNNPVLFLQYLCAALDSIQPGLAQHTAPLLGSGEPPRPEAVLTLLVNLLSQAEQDFVLVLDDYHLIEETSLHAALTFLLEHRPPRLHLALLTRADPALPLARLRTRGQLTELRAEHLRFTNEEAAAFLNRVMGLSLLPEQVAALEQRTEGWIAGLQLAALSMQGRQDIPAFIAAFAGSHHYIVDYLAEEVLGRLPEARRIFLMHTAILEQLCGPLCDAVTGTSSGDDILAELEHANLFVVSLDTEQRWYRYHNLFADLLRSRLVHACPELVPALHGRAAAWFEAQGMLDQAIQHALNAGDSVRAARLLRAGQLELLFTRSIATMDTWLKAFPEDFVLADPWLCVAMAHTLWSTGRRENIMRYIHSAQQVLAAWLAAGQMVASDPDYCLLHGECCAFSAIHANQQGQEELAISLAQEAVNTIPQTARARGFALGSLYVIYQAIGKYDRCLETCYEARNVARALNYPSMCATSVYSASVTLRIKGQLAKSEQVLREALDFAERQGQAHIFYYGLLHVGLAETYYEWYALDRMEAALNTGVPLLQQGGMSILVMLGLLDQVELTSAQGDHQGAIQALGAAERACQGMDTRVYLPPCNALRLQFQAALGETAGMVEWLQTIDTQVGQRLGTDRLYELSQAARFLNALGRPAEALHLLEKVEKVVRQTGCDGYVVYLLAHKAIAYKKLGEERQALACLQDALQLAEPEGHARPFLSLGEPMRELLHVLLRSQQRRGASPDFLARLLVMFARQGAAQAPPPPPAPPQVLSKRELELLRLIAAGSANKEIARDLVISLGTVKRHTVNIFTKLDVKNRTEAVAKARQLGLL